MLSEHEMELRVRYDETDPMGFVHHANYLNYFEIGRTELLRASGGNYRQMEEEGMLVVVCRVDCRYYRPARYDDVLTIRTVVDRIGPAKIEHSYSISRDGEPLVAARVTLAVVDRQGNVQRVPSWLQVDSG
jgi:acyl-CoA thioester hydrolase